jgi:hypothetical protein
MIPQPVSVFPGGAVMRKYTCYAPAAGGNAMPLIGAVILALLLAGCGGGDPGDEDGPGTVDPGSTGGSEARAELDACALLPTEDVQALLGNLPEASTNPVGPFQTCSYHDTMSNFIQFQVCDCLHGGEFDASVKSGSTFLEVEATPVSGVGEKAYWFRGILWVQQGDIAFNLWVSAKEYFEKDGTALEGDALDEAALSRTSELALKVLGRLE